MAYLRYDTNNSILIVLNLSNEIQKISFAHEMLEGSFINIFSGLAFSFDKELSFELLPGDYFLYVK
jgi:hypothetical protein